GGGALLQTVVDIAVQFERLAGQRQPMHGIPVMLQLDEDILLFVGFGIALLPVGAVPTVFALVVEFMPAAQACLDQPLGVFIQQAPRQGDMAVPAIVGGVV